MIRNSGLTKLGVHCYVVDGPILAGHLSGVVKNDENLSFFQENIVILLFDADSNGPSLMFS